MADNYNYTNPSAGTGVVIIGVDLCTVNGVANVGVPLGKVGFGSNDQFTYVDATHGLPVAVVGTVPVSIASMPSTPVTGTFWQGTQPVSLASLPTLPAGTNVIGHTITDTGSTTAVTGNVTIVQPTGTNLHAVVDSGTITAVTAITNALPAGANALGTVGLTDPALATATVSAADAASASSAGPNGQLLWTGTPTANSAASFAVAGVSAFSLQVTGTFVGTLAIEQSSDGGTTWVGGGGFVAGSAYTAGTLTTPGVIKGNTAASNYIRVRATAWTSGAAAVKLYASPATGGIKVENPVRLFDGVSGVQGTIKPASTASTATDTALVVVNRDGVSTVAETAGGATTYAYLASGAANQDAATVKGSPGQIRSWQIYNTTTTARWVKLYNKTGPTSADTPIKRLFVPPNGGNNATFRRGLQFSAALSHRVTTGVADNDTGACASNDVVVNIDTD